MSELTATTSADVALLDADLASLPTGTGLLYDPIRAGLDRVRFPANTTFDSSRTPRHGDTAPPAIAISSAFVEELRKALAPLAQDEPIIDGDLTPGAAEMIDRHATQRIASLEAQIAELQAELDRVRAAFRQTRRGDGDYFIEVLGRINRLAAQEEGALREWLDDDAAVVASEQGGEAAGSQRKGSSPVPTSRPEQADADAASNTPADTHRPPRQFRILQAIAWSAAYLAKPSAPRAIVAWIAETTAASSTFERDLGAMRTAGLIDYPAPGEVALTDDGRAIAPPLTRPRSRDALWQAISAKLPPRQIAIVECLLDGNERSRRVLADGVETSPSSSTFERDLGRLRTLGLILYPTTGQVQLADLLL